MPLYITEMKKSTGMGYFVFRNLVEQGRGICFFEWAYFDVCRRISASKITVKEGTKSKQILFYIFTTKMSKVLFFVSLFGVKM